MSNWTINDIPSQAGKLAVITGATGGLGYETALALAGAGAQVVLTGRNDKKGYDALARIRAIHPRANISYDTLDLGSLASVAAFTKRFAASHAHLDLLVNNAGVMAPPTRKETADGFELQFGTNYLGHFALTAQLLPLLSAARARIVQLSSVYAARGRIDFDDLHAVRSYRPFTSYGQSKLAMLMLALELQRRSDRGGWGLTSTAAHPGWSRTGLVANGPGSGGSVHSFIGSVIDTVLVPVLGQSAAAGAQPQLYASTAAEVVPGGYYGPDGPFELRGAPKAVEPAEHAKDQAVAAQLWRVSEEMTNMRFPTLARAA